MNVHKLTSRFMEITSASNPMTAARDVLTELKGEMAEVEDSLSYLEGVGGNARQSFYRTPNLSMLKVCFPNGRRTPPHNHGTWAAILVLSGKEKNTLYKRGDDGELVKVGEKILERGSVLPMPADVIHVVECLTDEPAVGLHVYGADVLGVERHMWDPDTLVAEPLDWDKYESLAQRASKAASAPLA